MNYVFGVSLLITGTVLRLWAIRTLGKDFRLYLAKPRKLRIDGAYRYLRHPGYAGSLLMLTGLCLIWPPLGIIWLGWAFFLARIIEEERFLQKLYPKEYVEYKQKVKRFGWFG